MATSRWGFPDMPDMSGRKVLITGANTGLGFAAARALAGKGACIVMGCRSIDKGRQARGQIVSDTPKADIRVEQLDVSDLQSVRGFAERELARGERLDILINNAGVMAVPKQLSADGFEIQLVTNHLGHFALAGLLMPRLLAAPNGRVVAVSSIAARSGRIDFDDLMGERRYDPWRAYNQSKLANLMFALELQRRLARQGVTLMAAVVHPGASLTNLFASPGSTFVKRVLSPVMRPFFQPVEAGVLPILYAATAPDIKPGGYYGPANLNEMKGPPAPARVPAQASDEIVARRLWAVSEQLTGVVYPQNP